MAVVAVSLLGCGDSQIHGSINSLPESDALASPDMGTPDAGASHQDQPDFPEHNEADVDAPLQTLVVLSGRTAIDRAFADGSLELRAAAPFETVEVHWEGAGSSMDVRPHGAQAWRAVELDFAQASSRRGSVELGAVYRRVHFRPTAPDQLLYVKVLGR
jgi:hypothetical protein